MKDSVKNATIKLVLIEWRLITILTNDFKTTCTDGEPHEPVSYGASHTNCKKCNQEVFMTNEGSGYYFTDKDCELWDAMYNGVETK